MKTSNGIIYGPVNSRRLGYSLGINLTPGSTRFCPFDCVYCYNATTQPESTQDIRQIKLPTPMQVENAVVKILQAGVEADYLTFSGNGEPTFHPRFTEIVDRIIVARDRYAKSLDIALLSDSAWIWKKTIQAAVKKLDVPILKLDAGDEETFQQINRPTQDISFKKILAGLKQLKSFHMQTLFVDGAVSNTGEEQVRNWLTQVVKIRPLSVQIYTIDRPVPVKKLQRVSQERLKEIAERVKSESGVAACVYASVKQDI